MYVRWYLNKSWVQKKEYLQGASLRQIRFGNDRYDPCSNYGDTS